MDNLRIKLLSLVLFVALCVTATYWVITLTRSSAVAQSPPSAAAVPSVASAEHLFGGSGERVGAAQLHVVGILSLGPGKGAAAIIGSSDGTTRTLAAGQEFDRDTRIAEVKGESVIIEHGHQRSEIFLSKPTQSMGYMR